MLLKIIGLTDSVITLNVLGVTLHGKVSGTFIIKNDNQLSEVKLLRKAGLIGVEDLEATQTEQELPKQEVLAKKDKPKASKSSKPSKPEATKVEPEVKVAKKSLGRGRPKGSKNKSVQKKTILTQDQKVKLAEEDTQKMGSDVIIATGNSFQKKKMRHSFAGEIPESAKTQESLDAMDKVLKEERDEEVEDKPTIDENKLDPSEQMGKMAVISDMGRPTKKEMKNSILPASADIKNRDPFIDRDDKKNEKDKSEEAFIGGKPDDDPSEAFIEV